MAKLLIGSFEIARKEQHSIEKHVVAIYLTHKNTTHTHAHTTDISATHRPMDLENCQRVAIKLARAAGMIITDAFQNIDSDSIQFKSKHDFVTDTDKKCEELILTGLRKEFPSHMFIGEETSDSNVKLTDHPTWMVDPLDGTTNFIHRFPYVSVSIGLAVNQRPVMGVVFAPLMNELYTAIKGKGAFLNGETRLKVSETTELSSALVATGFPKYREFLNFQLSVVNSLLQEGGLQALRSNGSCALDMCGVASGRLDMVFECTGICCWDYCAGSILVEEAGGKVADPISNGPVNLMARRVAAASSESLLKRLAHLISVRSPPDDTGTLPTH